MAGDDEAATASSAIETELPALAKRARPLTTDLDPAAFLKSVRELSEKREREDQERFRRLEEEVQKGRQERAARRAERARSISPEKQHASPPTSAPIPRPTANVSLPPTTMSPPSVADGPATASQRAGANMERETEAADGVPEFKGFGSVKRRSTSSNASQSPAPSRKASDDAPTMTTATGLARSGTLTWNRRPQSQLGGSRPQSQPGGSRPQSVAAASADSRSTHARNTSTDGPEPSREQIAASLGARDPAWFKQTADRGAGNAAFRKSRDEAQIATSTSVGVRALPGMSRESTTQPETQTSPDTSDSTRSGFISRGGSVRGSVMSAGSRSSAISSASSGKPDLTALVAEDEGQQRASPSFDQASVASNEWSGAARALTMSSSQARLSSAHDRAVSPTKGMGGFVQSAMMKRTDSQTKRWSAQPGTSLSRQNSVASTRSGHGGLQASHSMPKLQPAGIKESATDRSRSTTSSNDLTTLITQHDSHGFTKPALPSHRRSKSVASNYSTNGDVPASPGSPSKRFRSPTKSSWIESSLTRPESPKPAPAKNSQPSWMADLASRNAQRASAESTPLDATPKRVEDQGSRPASPTKQTPFGPQILKCSDSRDLPTTPASATSSNKPRPTRLADKFEASPSATFQFPQAAPENKPNVATTPETEPNTALHATPPSAVETKSEKSREDAAPKMALDLRSQLKSRDPPAAKSSEQPEFLSKFGQLRKTATEKYVAPDVLKANILRGKGDLNQTGGPFKTQRRDELKESLLAKKDDMKKAKEEGRDLPSQAHERKTSAEQPQAPSKPEALARRELLGRPDSAKKAAAPADRTREGMPEALARHKSLKSRDLPKTAPKPSSREIQEELPVPTPEGIHVTKKQTPEVSQQESARSAVKNDTWTPGKSVTSPDPVESKMEPLSRQTNSPSATDGKKEISKLAERFNPGLAGMLARRPPSQPRSRSETPVNARQAFSPPLHNATEPLTAGAPLNDMRKDRAKGPKRRKAGAKTDATSAAVSMLHSERKPEAGNELPQPLNELGSDGEASTRPQTPPGRNAGVSNVKSFGPPGSTAALMNATLTRSPRPLSFRPHGEGPVTDPPGTPGSPATKPHPGDSPPPESPWFKKPQGARAVPGPRDVLTKASSEQPSASGKQDSHPIAAVIPKALTPRKADEPLQAPPSARTASPIIQAPTMSEPPAAVPELKELGASRGQNVAQPAEEDKENSSLPPVKAATLLRDRRPLPAKNEAPPQTQLPTKKDEEAAMRSAGLLAAIPKPGLEISVAKSGDKAPMPVSAGAPPKPLKSSRSVSGLLAESSPNKGENPPRLDEPPKTEVGRLLAHHFKQVPRYREPLALDTSAIISRSDRDVLGETVKTLRRRVHVCFPDGSSKLLPQQHEYTLYDEAVYLCVHTFANAKSSKTSHIYLWAGVSAFERTVEAANVNAKRISREHGAAQMTMVRQGYEPAALLDALGGILVTRRGSGESVPKQFMLCGRKHLRGIVFDEVDFGIESLCAGFVYLISYPLSLQQTKLFLWKGSACSTEELSGARLAAMDLSDTGEIIEVDGGVDFPSSMTIFGASTAKWQVPRIWQHKAAAPDKFQVKLLRISHAEAPSGILSAIWNRRPSWNSLSPSRSPGTANDVPKVEVHHLTPFTQSQLEPEGVYLLDGHSELYLLLGPLFRSQPERVRNAILGQSLLFASDYAILCASMEDRVAVPKCWVVFSGVPRDVKMLFRHWDESRALWGTGSLMAGETGSAGREVNALALDEVLQEVCKA